MSNFEFLLSCVYESPNMKNKENLWSHLHHLKNMTVGVPWTVLGYFNSYLYEEEKVGGGRPNLIAMRLFRNCINSCDLFDLGFVGPAHTWTNGRTKERLDRCLVNSSWDQSFQDSKVWHLNQLKSDHRPILLKINCSSEETHYRPLFRFQYAWLTNDSFKDVVKGAWAGDMIGMGVEKCSLRMLIPGTNIVLVTFSEGMIEFSGD